MHQAGAELVALQACLDALAKEKGDQDPDVRELTTFVIYLWETIDPLHHSDILLEKAR